MDNCWARDAALMVLRSDAGNKEDARVRFSVIGQSAQRSDFSPLVQKDFLSSCLVLFLTTQWRLVESVLTEYTMLLTIRSSAFRQARCCLTPSNSFHRQHQSAFVRILSSLAVLEQRDGKLQTASLSAVTAAQKLGGPITGFVAGSQVRSVAEEAAKIKGIEKIIMVDNGIYERVRLLYPIRFRSCMITSNTFLGSP